jgi:hypothetical protein
VLNLCENTMSVFWIDPTTAWHKRNEVSRLSKIAQLLSVTKRTMRIQPCAGVTGASPSRRELAQSVTRMLGESWRKAKTPQPHPGRTSTLDIRTPRESWRKPRPHKRPSAGLPLLAEGWARQLVFAHGDNSCRRIDRRNPGHVL